MEVGPGAWNNQLRNDWTAERVEKLRALALEEYTSGQIAKMLGGVSRSAVVAKCKRLGYQLSWRKLGLPFEVSADTSHLGNPATALKRHARNATPGGASSKSGVRLGVTLAPTATQTDNATLADLFPVPTNDTVNFNQRSVSRKRFAKPTGDGVTMAQLGVFHCRWPLGCPQTEEFRFCGEVREGAAPYCGFHCSKAYIIPPPAKPRSWRRA